MASEAEEQTPSIIFQPAPPELAGRSATEPDIVRWVSRNIDNPEVKPDDCPDPFAWTLLRNCIGNPTFQAFFIEKLWAKLLPSRAQMEGAEAQVELDGQHIIDLIDRIQAIGQPEPTGQLDCGEGASVPAGPHNPGFAGAIPAPAITDAFATYNPEEDPDL